MRRTHFVATLATAALVAVFTAAPASANSLVDPGFEGSLTFDGAPFLGSWEGFAGGTANADATPTNPLSGAQSLELFVGDVDSFAGAFQDIAAGPGDLITWSGSHALASGSNGTPGGTEIRIEFLDAGLGVISATPNLTPTLTPDDTYVPFSLTEVAPGGTAFARLVYAIQSFGAPAPQQVFVDDVSGVVIPEPAALSLVALGAVAMVARRRRV